MKLFCACMRVLAFGCMSLIVMLQGMQTRYGGYPETPKKRALENPKTPERPLKKQKGPQISPQIVPLRAENSSRKIFNALLTGGDDASMQALKVLLNWYERFPVLFSKIKWATPQDQAESMQIDFKYNLAAALHYCIYQCMAQSSSLKIDVPIFEEKNNCCTSSITLGGFLLSSTICKNNLNAQHVITLVDGHEAQPQYNAENKIKAAIMAYLFSSVDRDDFQSILQEILSAIPEDIRVAKEQFYHALVYGMISFMGSSFSIVEAYSGQGRADLILVSDANERFGNANCVIEFKYNHSVKEALAQIETMNYSKYFGEGTVVAVGINITGNPFTVTCGKKLLLINGPNITTGDNAVSGAISWK